VRFGRGRADGRCRTASVRLRGQGMRGRGVGPYVVPVVRRLGRALPHGRQSSKAENSTAFDDSPFSSVAENVNVTISPMCAAGIEIMRVPVKSRWRSTSDVMSYMKSAVVRSTPGGVTLPSTSLTGEYV